MGTPALTPGLFMQAAPLLQTGESIAITAYLALDPMFIAFVSFGLAVQTLHSSTATSITLLKTFVGTVPAITVVGERLLSAGWVGLGLILIAVVVLPTARQTHVAPVSP